MRYRQGDLGAARAWFDACQRRVPAYAPALGRLAGIDAAQLACALTAAGHSLEAGPWRASAAARYDELARRHPQAYAGHAAEFRRQAADRGPVPA
jgi:hypothetical protein